MAGSSSTPVRRKKSQINYLGNIGEVGRRTGLTLAEGPRDEYGMEDADHLFTSPAKSMKSAKSLRSQRKSNMTIASSESMDLEDEGMSAPSSRGLVAGHMRSSGLFSSALTEQTTPEDAPDPRSHLTARSRNAAPRRSIPRSPFHRTNIGSSPRRHPSLDPRSDQRRESSVASQRSVTHLLDFDDDAPLQLVEHRSSNRKRTPLRHDQDEFESNSDRNAYSLSNSPLAPKTSRLRPLAPPPPRFVEDVDDPEDEPEDEQYYEGPPPIEDDEDGEHDVDESQNEGSVVVRAPQEAPRPGRGRPRKSGGSDVSQVNGASQASAKGRRTSNRRLTAEPVSNDLPDDAGPEYDDGPLPDQDADGDIDPEIPEEDDDADAQQPQTSQPAPKARGRPRKEKKAALAEKDRNARKATKREPKPAAERGTSAPRDFRGTSVPLHRAKELEPEGDDGAAHTRSGRLTYRPIQFWKNERLEYDNDGRHGMQTIRSIVRMEERTPVKRAASVQPGRKKKRRGAKATVYEAEAEEEVEEEDWELEDGIVTGQVHTWDSFTGNAEQETETREIAFAGNRIETREVAGAMFRYAKTLTMPFFGSGMVELPPHGFKRMKNSRKMQMVFFVHFGKVRVEVGDISFVITKGGVWQVPRGNFYSITNETDKEAKIFFAQGCEVTPDDLTSSQNGPDA